MLERTRRRERSDLGILGIVRGEGQPRRSRGSGSGRASSDHSPSDLTQLSGLTSAHGPAVSVGPFSFLGCARARPHARRVPAATGPIGSAPVVSSPIPGYVGPPRIDPRQAAAGSPSAAGSGWFALQGPWGLEGTSRQRPAGIEFKNLGLDPARRRLLPASRDHVEYLAWVCTGP
jgi:hypothetical protein